MLCYATLCYTVIYIPFALRRFGFVSCDGNRPDVFCHAEGCRDVDRAILYYMI